MDKQQMTIWLACAVDSEGTIGLAKSKRKEHSVYAPRVQITNKNKDYIDFAKHCMEQLGCKVNEVKLKIEKNDNWSNVWNISVNRQSEIYLLLDQLYPQLIIKRKQAKVVSEYCQMRLKYQFKRKNYTYSGNEEQYYLELKALNMRGL